MLNEWLLNRARWLDLDKKVPIADLLRKALVVAKNLKIEEFGTWVTRKVGDQSVFLALYTTLLCHSAAIVFV